MAKQTSPAPLMEYLLPILTIAWDNFQKAILPMNFEPSIAMEKAQEIIERIIDGSPIPKHLEPHTRFQAGKWEKRLVEAALHFQVDRDYVININADGNKVINPVDSSTGVAQENMLRQNGLHQFLQIKQNCRISWEGLTTYITYFLKYGKILGMTCTLGSDSSQNFLKTIYGVDLSFVPTYEDRQDAELPGQLEITLDALIKTVCESSYQKVILHNRAVLIVCKNIKDVEDFCVALKNKCGRRIKLLITQEVKINHITLKKNS
jgi:preprotein translocase subunit SecA